MKKLLIALFTIVLMTGLFACNQTGGTVNPSANPTNYETITVILDMTAYDDIITVDNNTTDYTGKIKTFTVESNGTLEDTLNELAADKKLTFSGDSSIAGLMITKIDNITLSGNQFFALYTNDTDNSDTAWGTYQVFGKTLGSALVGVSSLNIKDDCLYVICISSF